MLNPYHQSDVPTRFHDAIAERLSRRIRDRGMARSKLRNDVPIRFHAAIALARNSRNPNYLNYTKEGRLELISCRDRATTFATKLEGFNDLSGSTT